MVKNGHVIVHADMCATTVRYIYIKDDNLEDFVSHLNLKWFNNKISLNIMRIANIVFLICH